MPISGTTHSSARDAKTKLKYLRYDDTFNNIGVGCHCNISGEATLRRQAVVPGAHVYEHCPQADGGGNIKTVITQTLNNVFIQWILCLIMTIKYKISDDMKYSLCLLSAGLDIH